MEEEVIKGKVRNPSFISRNLRRTSVSAAPVNFHLLECVFSLPALPPSRVAIREETKEKEEKRVAGLIFFIQQWRIGITRWGEVRVRESAGGRVSSVRETPYRPLYSVRQEYRE